MEGGAVGHIFEKAKKKYMCVYCRMSKKYRVGRSGLFFFFFYLLSTKLEIVVPKINYRETGALGQKKKYVCLP
jgi:hypothetical protein